LNLEIVSIVNLTYFCLFNTNTFREKKILSSRDYQEENVRYQIEVIAAKRS